MGKAYDIRWVISRWCFEHDLSTQDAVDLVEVVYVECGMSDYHIERGVNEDYNRMRKQRSEGMILAR